ncbi:hypothetical protein [Microbacterium enclense]|uniref:hypothetical protein n=1 Tax=Microbacterium enclense TaxID=993073 RepID=UPI003F7EA250
MSTWDESSHSRDRAGRFAETSGSEQVVLLEHAEHTFEFGAAPATEFITWWGKPERLETAAENWMLGDFEAEHPDPTPDDFRDFLLSPPPECSDDGEPNENSDTRRSVVRSISARLVAGQPGTLIEASSLKPGDSIDLSRFWDCDDYLDLDREWARANRGVVNDRPTESRDGTTIFRLSNYSRPVILPNGTLIPALR